VYPKQPGDLGSWAVVLQHLLRFPDLRTSQLRRPPKAPTSQLGRLDPAALALPGLLTLQFGERCKGLSDEAADQGGGPLATGRMRLIGR
jgi:hypothetical protein